MSLKPILDSLEGLHEEVAKLYTKKDGKFVLDVEDSGLKSALQKERDRAEAAEKALKAREESESAEKAKKEREDLERKGEYEKLSAADKAALQAEKDKNAKLEATLRNGARDRALMEAMADPSVKGIPKALLPHVTDLVEVIPDGDGFKVVPKANPAQKLTDLISSLKADMAWGFEGVNASGGGAGQSGGTPSTHAAIFDPKSPTYNYTKQMELAKENPALFQSLRTQFPETKQE